MLIAVNNSTIAKVVKSLQGGSNGNTPDHLKGHGSVSWDKYPLPQK